MTQQTESTSQEAGAGAWASCCEKIAGTSSPCGAMMEKMMQQGCGEMMAKMMDLFASQMGGETSESEEGC